MPPDEKLIHDVVQLDKGGMKRRAIARALRISRNTVRRILAEHGGARLTLHSALPRPRTWTRPSKLDVFRPQVDELLQQYADITAQRVFEVLREKGFGGGYTGVKDLVRRIRPKSPPKPSLETPPRVPGDMAECDWSPYNVTFTHAPPMTLQVFGYMLRHSTRKYYGFHEGNGLHPLMDGHVHAFKRFGGAARKCKYDNQKPVVRVPPLDRTPFRGCKAAADVVEARRGGEPWASRRRHRGDGGSGRRDMRGGNSARGGRAGYRWGPSPAGGA